MPASKYLLDTNCLIWFQENNPKLPEKVLHLIEDTKNTIYFSQISVFEIAIKLKLGKLPNFLTNVEDVYQAAILDEFKYLPINNQHIFNYQSVPLLIDHRDPFDRLLIASAMHENATILSADRHFENYTDLIDLVW